jgi:hypothetical protein
MKLNAHRQNLKSNPNCFSQDKDRAIKNMAKYIWEWARTQNDSAEMKKSKKMPHILKMCEMLWQAQEERPLLYFDSVLPLCWNSPKDWAKCNYLKYEIGHMNPKNNGGDSNPENLCFMSARCNQHIQSALSLDEVIEAYFPSNKDVLQRIERLKTLYNSKEWLECKIKLLNDN